MLTPMDDTLWHTLPTTFDHVGTSDPRFFDRYWFAASDPAGGGTLQLTLGVYNNMNVVDAGFVAIRDGRQHNVRASRSLRTRIRFRRCSTLDGSPSSQAWAAAASANLPLSKQPSKLRPIQKNPKVVQRR